MEIIHVLGLLLAVSVVCSIDPDFVFPPVRIQAFRPKGVRVSIPDVPGKITFFSFNGNVNKRITDFLEFGQIRGEVKQAVNGRWSFEDPNQEMKIGDVIYYYVMLETGVIEGSLIWGGKFKGNQKHIVHNLEDISNVPDTSQDDSCEPTLTLVNGHNKRICSGQTLLEDFFYNGLNRDTWQVEQYVPIDNPEYPFVSYQRSAVSIVDRQLQIEAKLQQMQPGFTETSMYVGTLNLIDGCTSPVCSKEASGPDILPPVVTGRLTSKGFAFKYGVIHVRAKLPKGDWLYPEIMLEPLRKKYGHANYASGVLRIASARGNEYLVTDTKDYGNKVLYGGPIMDFDCRENLLSENVLTNNSLWSDNFHTYTMRWTPHYIELSVDGNEWAYLEGGNKGLKGRFPDNCTRLQRSALVDKMAPFDDFELFTDVPGKITFFSFNGNVNKRITDFLEFGQIRGEVKQAVNGRWSFEDPNQEMKIGDVIYYYVMLETGVIEGSLIWGGKFKGNQKHIVHNLEDISNVPDTSQDDSCEPTLTLVNGHNKRICSGQTLLEDFFYNGLNRDTWQVEQYVPIDNPEYPFVSYQRSAVSIVDRQLQIEAKLQQMQPGFTETSMYVGTLNLIDGCTSPVCSKEASGPDILPPVVTGRLTSKGFAFKYGVIHVRAKLPKGDWLYPEIMLEPLRKKYGHANYASGVLRIASARGNEYLVTDTKDYGNKVLYGGPIMDFDCRENLLSENVLTNNSLWSDNFHTYTMRWTPHYIELSVDGNEWAYLEGGNKGLKGRFPDNCTRLQRSALVDKMAPFDDFFYITLGVSVGGISEFRDEVKTGMDRPKPWRNAARKGMLHFWQDLAAWHSTWKQPKLIVEFVKVFAL